MKLALLKHCFYGIILPRKKEKKEMKMKNQNGFLHIIACLLIGVIFAFTVYACLDVLNLIEVPEEYSVAKWLETYSQKDATEDETKESLVQNIAKRVRIEVENKTVEGESSNFDISQMNQYQSSQGTINSDVPMADFLYYHQLDNYGKTIYLELEKNLDNMKTGTYNVSFGKTFNDLLHQENGEAVLNQSFQLAINALNFDHPDLFYLDVSKIYLLTKITTKLWITTYEVEIGSSQGQNYLNPSFASKADVDQAIDKIEAEKQRIKARLYGNIENQIKGVHDYLVDQLEYESTLSKDNIYNLYGAMINHLTVCEGYARSFKYLMDDLGVPCLIACGTAVNNSGETENHAWNYVLLNGKWYAVDVTWDDPVIIGNGRVSQDIKYRYYLKGADAFFTNHTEDGNIVGNAGFQYPALSSTNY